MLKLIFRDLFIYQRRNLFILPGFAFFFVIYAGGAGSAVFSMTLIVISLFALTMTAQTAFSYDETSKFNRFLRAMPVTPSTIVLSRYVSCLLSSLMGAVLVILFGGLANAVSMLFPVLHRDMAFDMTVLFTMLAVVLFFCAILMPILFKFGYMKTKYPLLLIFVALAAGGPTILSSTAINQKLIDTLSSVSSTNSFIIVLFAVSLLAVYGSIKLTVAVFKKKEE